MSESEAHKRAKTKAAGPGGRTEVPLPSGGRLDAMSSRSKATEIERSHDPDKIKKAVQRLDEAPAKVRELKVPQSDLEQATKITQKNAKHPITVTNITGTQGTKVKPK